MAFVGVNGIVAGRKTASRATCVKMSSSEESTTPDRREFILGAAAAAFMFVAPNAARADIEYDGVPFLGGAEQIDVNNANIRVFQKYPGLYPNIGRLIVKYGPYKDVAQIYEIPELTDAQKETIKKYEDKLVTLEPRPEYVSSTHHPLMYSPLL